MSSEKVKAGWEKSANTQRAKTADVIKDFQKIHGDFYDYSKMKYIRSKDKVEIICPVHGSFFQPPGDHKRGNGCPDCSLLGMIENKRKPLKDVIADFIKVHGDMYDYTGVYYKGAWVPVEIRCSTHGAFYQAPEHHRRGSGCPACTASGFNPLKPAILYYVKVTHTSGVYYKIGITNRTIEARFGKDMPMITVLKTWEYTLGAEAYQAEQTILTLNQEHRYSGDPLLVCGNTELFNIDVGGYDYE